MPLLGSGWVRKARLQVDYQEGHIAFALHGAIAVFDLVQTQAWRLGAFRGAAGNGKISDHGEKAIVFDKAIELASLIRVCWFDLRKSEEGESLDDLLGEWAGLQYSDCTSISQVGASGS